MHIELGDVSLNHYAALILGDEYVLIASMPEFDLAQDGIEVYVIMGTDEETGRIPGWKTAADVAAAIRDIAPEQSEPTSMYCHEFAYLRRLRSLSVSGRWHGCSSDAMSAWAFGVAPRPEYTQRPHDHDDWHACRRAYEYACQLGLDDTILERMKTFIDHHRNELEAQGRL